MDPSNTELLTGLDLHQQVIIDGVLEAEEYVWIATANLKDMHVRVGKKFRPILETFNHMAQNGVRFRVVHSDLPSRLFRKTLDKFPELVGGALELQICLRSHWKMVIVDGKSAYFGSANFTGAGLGARGENKRNLELGLFTTDQDWVVKLQTLFDSFWIGTYCENCSLHKQCPDPIEID